MESGRGPGYQGMMAMALLSMLPGMLLAQEPLPCGPVPRYHVLPLPVSGFRHIGTDQLCDPIPTKDWRGENGGLSVHLDGPEGPGRWWTVTVGVAEAGSPTPGRGLCLDTSTVGWRALQRFQNRPLPWVEDRDGDGRAELVIWDSFPLSSGQGSEVETGLIGWVYQRRSANTLALDWGMTRGLAREVAREYRRPAVDNLEELRLALAEVLEGFASGACRVAVGKEPLSP